MRRGQAKRLDSGGRGPNNTNATKVNRRGVDLQRRRGGIKSGVVSDARLRIIQKNRQKLTDARDKLAEIAKQTDARIKLEKLRENRVRLFKHYYCLLHSSTFLTFVNYDFILVKK